jgi:hypothetical protein
MGVECDTIDRHKDGFREMRLVEEFDKVCVVERHGKLPCYSLSFTPILYTSMTSLLTKGSTKEGMKEERTAYMGCANTTGDILERPRIGASSTNMG